MNWINVLKLCGEGGSITLQGRKNENGTWNIRCLTNELVMDDLLSEEDAEGLKFNSESKVVVGLDNAIEMLNERYPYWANLYPKELSPEFASSIIQYALSQKRCRKNIWEKELDKVLPAHGIAQKQKGEIMTIKIATWNVQRPRTGGRLNPQRLQKIQKYDADIWILTETREVISLGDNWYSLSSFPIPDYHAEGETLVTIWSKWPIRAVSASRFTACAEIMIPSLGSSLIYGTVIPWDKDEGFSKRFKAGRWEEHRRQVKVQTTEWEVLAKSYPEHLMCIAGDFNQHRDLIGSYKDVDSVAKISDSLSLCGLECITENNDKCANLSKPLVDHICLSKSLVASSSLTVWPYDGVDEVRLSDHHGVMVTIASQENH